MASTKAIALLQKRDTSFSVRTYDYDPTSTELGMQAAEALGISPRVLLKTLMLQTPAGPMIALIPSNRQLNLKAFASATKVKSCTLMPRAEAERISGYVIGGISPIGQKKHLPTYIDLSVEDQAWIMCNGGQRGVQVKLAPANLAQICNAKFAALSL